METIERMDRSQQESKAPDVTGESKVTKRNRGYELAESRLFTEKNAEIDYKILLALYEHRALTPVQVQKVWFPEAHKNSIRNRMKALADRKILLVNSRAGLSSRPVNVYSLSAFGLRILTDNVLEVMEYVPQFDERKQHYTVDDLKVRHQHQHHYELQEWITDVLAEKSDLLHCEWRRFPFIEQTNDIQVKPDWLIVEVEEEIKGAIKDDKTKNPLLYPYLYRKEIFPDTKMQPILCVECDRGTMNRAELFEKWEGYLKLPEQYWPEAIAVFHNPEQHGEVRHRSIRDTLSHAFEAEVIDNRIQLFQGDAKLTQKVVNLYLHREKDLLKGEEMIEELALIKLVKGYDQSTENMDISILDVHKTVGHFNIPLKPDAILMKEENGERTLQFVFYSIPGWINPLVKIKALKRWMKDGHLSSFADIKFILLYPDTFLEDITPTDQDIFFVSFKEIEEAGQWGKAHFEQRKNKQVKWKEVEL